MKPIGNNAWLSGVIADLPSPFDANDAIDTEAFALLCERQIAAGATALLVGETAGEMATLTADEHDTLVRVAAKTSRGRAKIIAGAGGNGTSQTIALATRAAAAGADALMLVVPYYNKPTQCGIEAHFRAVADMTALPIILHDNPDCCARGLADTTLINLCGDCRIIGLRDSSGDITRPLRLRLLKPMPAGFKLLSGDDATAFDYLMHSGDGLVSALANVAPTLQAEMYRAFVRGDLMRAAILTARCASLREVLAPDGSAASLKYALALCGVCSPRVRLPTVALHSRQKAAVTEATAAALRQ